MTERQQFIVQGSNINLDSVHQSRVKRKGLSNILIYFVRKLKENTLRTRPDYYMGDLHDLNFCQQKLSRFGGSYTFPYVRI